ncbi:hypothetical protein LUZ62_040146 [Rhynchospora pubera]|uniref:RING-type E3 ubiquitin transferase n=1 Tax=Rhynchospora pubera TaxID=906938 RepID=A0AAV8F5H9_9POAL|nr:hypothetical protein LUZ62_040146 [Rhynchospora pubera]
MARSIVESSSSSQAPSVPDTQTQSPSYDINATAGLVIGIVFFICIILNFILRLFLATKYNQRLQRQASAAASAKPKLGLSSEEISLLPKYVYQPSGQDDHEYEPSSSALDCAVCINELVQEEMVRVLPTCNHFFHVECIDRWLLVHSSCPLCRAQPMLEKMKLDITSASPIPQLRLCRTANETSELASMASPLLKSLSATNLNEIRNEVQSSEESSIL